MQNLEIILRVEGVLPIRLIGPAAHKAGAGTAGHRPKQKAWVSERRSNPVVRSHGGIERKRSAWKSVPNVILSLQASKSWSIPRAVWNASNVVTRRSSPPKPPSNFSPQRTQSSRRYFFVFSSASSCVLCGDFFAL